MSTIRPHYCLRYRAKSRFVSKNASAKAIARRTRLLCEPLEARRLLDSNSIMPDGDFNGDYQVDMTDLNLVLFNWNEVPRAVSSTWTEHRSANEIGMSQLNDVLFRWHDGMGGQPHDPGSVQGMKWEDLDGNGQRDANEPGLGGVTIYSDRNHNGVLDAHESYAVTREDDPNTDFDETGHYWFGLRRGRHLIREVVPDGFVQTFPVGFHTSHPLNLIDVRLPPLGAHFVVVHPGESVDEIDFGNRQTIEPELGVIYGTKWRDTNGDGSRAATEPGMTGVTIYSDLNHNGILDLDEPHTVTREDDPITRVDETGRFSLIVRPGAHVIREVVPEEFIQTFPFGFFPFDFRAKNLKIPIIPGAHLVFVKPGGAVDGVDFGNKPIDLAPASVQGVKWKDVDGDRDRDPGEPGLSGVTIFSDLNENGRLDSGEPHTVTMRDISETDFDESGRYQLDGLRPGRHSILEVVPDGYLPTFPTAEIMPAIFPPPPMPHDVFLESGGTVDKIDFGNQPLSRAASVRGTKWNDLNGNGQRDDDEPGLPGVIIYLDVNLNGEFDDEEPHAVTKESVADTATDRTGEYWIGNVEPGFYLLREVVPDGFVQTFPHVLRCKAIFCTGRAHLINLGVGDRLHGINFGNRQVPPAKGSVHGVKWEDINGNGRRDENEPGVAGVVIYSDLDHNGTRGSNEPHAVTREDNPNTPVDEMGRYRLEELQPGFHAIREVVPDGSEQIFPDPFLPRPADPKIPSILPPSLPGAHFVLLENGGQMGGLDFGNRSMELQLGTIQGTKWLDRDGDARRDRNEPGLPGVVIYVDLNNDGTLDDDEPRTVTRENDITTRFDETGRYWLPAVPTGNQVVREIVPAGFRQTFPHLNVGVDRDTGNNGDNGSPDEFALVNPESIHVTLADGDVLETIVSITLQPLFLAPEKMDVVALNAELPVVNLSGIQLNSGGGDDSTFEILIFGDGGAHHFELVFVGLTGNIHGVIPVSIDPPNTGGFHEVVVEPGEVVERINFGNQSLIGLRMGWLHGVKWEVTDGDLQPGPNEMELADFVFTSQSYNGYGFSNQDLNRIVPATQGGSTSGDVARPPRAALSSLVSFRSIVLPVTIESMTRRTSLAQHQTFFSETLGKTGRHGKVVDFILCSDWCGRAGDRQSIVSDGLSCIAAKHPSEESLADATMVDFDSWLEGGI